MSGPERSEEAANPNDRLNLNIQVEALSEDRLFEIIRRDFLELENLHYRKGGNISGEAKLLFLVGGEELDVTVAKTSDGKEIYTKEANHPKSPEISEATSAISNHFEESRNLPKVLAEIADIWYNLIQLTILDPEFEKSYMLCIDKLCETLGFSRQQAYLLTVTKYKCRLIDQQGKKDIPEEIERITALVENNSTLLPIPSDEAIAEAFRVINRMGEKVLKTRLLQLIPILDWSAS